MNPESRAEAKKLFADLRAVSRRRKASVVICPPFLFVPLFGSERLPKGFHIGAQDCFWERDGSYTGETSPAQLRDHKVSFVLVGHSERRALGESDAVVSRKVGVALKEGLVPVICVGESERDEAGAYLEFLQSQLANALSEVTPAKLKQVIIAYEPVWAIGKKDDEAITGHLLHEMSIFIRRFLAQKYGKKSGFSVPILYGGSVSPRNTEEILKDGNVNGLLIGRQSRDPNGFSEILDIVDSL